MLVVKNQPYRTLPNFRGKPVRRLAHDGSTFSGVGASGKPGAVRLLGKPRLAQRIVAPHRLRQNPFKSYVTLLLAQKVVEDSELFPKVEDV
jgi:hypothetical protein